MKSMLKKLAVLLSVLMLAIALTGCSQKPQPAPFPLPAPSDAPAVETPATEEAPANP